MISSFTVIINTLIVVYMVGFHNEELCIHLELTKNL